MANRTILISLPNEKIANYLLNEHFINSCESAGIVIRCEPYDLDIFNDLNLKALELEKAHTLNELENEILHLRQCINGTCED